MRVAYFPRGHEDDGIPVRHPGKNTGTLMEGTEDDKIHYLLNDNPESERVIPEAEIKTVMAEGQGLDMDDDSLDGDSNEPECNRHGTKTDSNSEKFDDKNPFHNVDEYDDGVDNPTPQSNSIDSLSQSNSSTNENSELVALLPFNENQEQDSTGKGQAEAKSRLPVKCTIGQNRKSSLPTQKAASEPLVKVQKKIVKSKTIDSPKGAQTDDKKKLSRGESQTCLASGDSRGVRETLTSRMRFEKRHVTHEQECEGDEYLTPTQRKEQLLKDLKIQVKDLMCVIEEKNQQIERLKQNIDEESRRIIQQKDEEAQSLKSDLGSLQSEHDDLKKSYQKSLLAIVNLEDTVSQLKERIALEQKKNESIYLEMYRKGQESAQFERNVELERLAVNAESSSMTMNELIRKLVVTESELAKWQSLRRQESYDSAEKPETQADVTLRFLKDSFFHYLTDTKDSDHHLRAMIRIFHFSEVQKKKITTSITEKKNKNA